MGRVWDNLGPLMATFGQLLAVLGHSRSNFFQTLAQDGLQEAFWIDFGWISEGIWKDWGRIWDAFGISKLKLLGHSCMFLGITRSLLRRLFGILVGVSWASLESLGQLSRDAALFGKKFKKVW